MLTQAAEVLKRLGIESENSGAYADEWMDCAGEELESHSPIDGSLLGTVRMADSEDYDDVVYKAAKVFQEWRMTPAPKRGQIVREIADELRKHKDDLGTLITLEM